MLASRLLHLRVDAGKLIHARCVKDLFRTSTCLHCNSGNSCLPSAGAPQQYASDKQLRTPGRSVGSLGDDLVMPRRVPLLAGQEALWTRCLGLK